MKRLIAKRLIHLLPVLLGMSLAAFFIIQAAPGDFFSQMALNPEISPETISLMKQEFGLDKPVAVQYLYWLKNLALGNLGISFSYHLPVTTLIRFRLLNTLSLAFFSMMLSWLIALPLGVFAGYRERSISDRLSSAFAYLSISMPSFFLALLCVYLASKTTFIPIGGTRSVFDIDAGLWSRFVDYFKHLLLPGLVLAFVNIGWLFRLMRNNFIEAYGSPYIRAAWAKGLPVPQIIFRHAFKNALNPMFTILGLEIGSLLNGAALVEIVTNWPGMGSLMLDAVLSQDLYLVMGSLIIGGVLLIAGNLIGDLLLMANDPRIRLS
ncbi:MAG: ABC transporter permease [Candidatus Ratteibacteria bacterium]|jgi:peptide/nickel transport system permease protein